MSMILLLSQVSLADGWPLFRANPQRTGLAPEGGNYSGTPQLKAEWLIIDEGYVFLNSPAAADLNGDGRRDLLLAGWGGGAGYYPLAVAYTSDGTLLWEGGELLSGPESSSPALADANGDGIPEAFFVGHSYLGFPDTLYCVNGSDGSTLWARALENTAWASSPLIGPDGRMYVADDQGNLYCLNPSDGSLIWQLPQSLGEALSGVSWGDVNADDAPELVYTAGGHLLVADTTGGLLWDLNLGSGATTPALADLDGNGDLEIWVYCHTAGQLRVYDFANSTPLIAVNVGAWTENDTLYTEPHLPPSPAVGDMNADGTLDAVIHSRTQITAVDGATGSILWQNPAYELYGSPTLANMDGDPYLEVVVGGRPEDPISRCKVELYDDDGTLLWQWWSSGAYFNDEVPGEVLVLNLDDDPEAELAAVDYSCWTAVLDNQPEGIGEAGSASLVYFRGGWRILTSEPGLMELYSPDGRRVLAASLEPGEHGITPPGPGAWFVRFNGRSIGKIVR